MNEIPELYGRKALHSNWDRLDESDQAKGVECPVQQKPCPEGAVIVSLPEVGLEDFSGTDLNQAIWNRKSRRKYNSDSLSLKELTYLLFATQGVHKAKPKFSMRTAPSGGARHPFETYLAVFNIDGLEPGLYRYLPLDHALCRLKEDTDLRPAAEAALHNQGWGAPVIFYWTTVPYRTEWRYQAASHKIVALDAGHLCQNLYLACEAIGAGTCAIGAYDQAACDGFLDVDGTDEYMIYAAPVGKVAK